MELLTIWLLVLAELELFKLGFIPEEEVLGALLLGFRFLVWIPSFFMARGRLTCDRNCITSLIHIGVLLHLSSTSELYHISHPHRNCITSLIHIGIVSHLSSTLEFYHISHPHGFEPTHPMKFEVKTTGIANWLAFIVPSPKSCR